MKPPTILLILFLFSGLVKSQYRKLPLDSNHYWQQTASIKTLPGPVAYCTYYLKARWKSVINGYTYRLVSGENVSCNPYYPLSQDALLREDTVQRKVIIRMNNKDWVLYNFSKNPGDTVMMHDALTGPLTHTVLLRDSVLCNDGLYHRRFYLSGLAYPILEGIGSLGGLLTPGKHFEQGYYLACLGRETPPFSIYSSGGAGTSCPLTIGIGEAGSLPSGTIVYPNPASDRIFIRCENLRYRSVEVRNLVGETVLHSKSPGRDTAEIPVSGMPDGLYILLLDSEEGVICRVFAKE
jgi:hypothetical protein